MKTPLIIFILVILLTACSKDNATTTPINTSPTNSSTNSPTTITTGTNSTTTITGTSTTATFTFPTSTASPTSVVCDFKALTVSKTESYDFGSNFTDYFSDSTRWVSDNADLVQVNGIGQVKTSSTAVSDVLEAWKLFKIQLPYNKSWEISIDVNIPLYWNSNGGSEAQVGAGIFVGRPVPTGESSKVYECNMAVINGKARFVQAQLVATRLGGDPIDVQIAIIDNAKENGNLKIKFCTIDKTLSLYIDDTIVGRGRAIDATGLDNWTLTDSDLMDVGVMGFAEKALISSNPPTIDNFSYKIY